MAAVKGSKTTRLKVVPHRPHHRLVTLVSLVLTFLLACGGSYWWGKHNGLSLQEEAIAERQQLRRELQAKVAEAEALSQQVANLKMASEVDQASSEDVRNQVIDLKGQIAALEEDIAFYRGLMAPSDNRRGLAIGSVDVIPTGVPRQYDFKVVVQQLATNHQVLNGSLRMTIVGHEGELARSFAIKELSPQVESETIRLRFKYFQNIEGQIRLPEGFEPEGIELVARSTGSNGVSVEKKFGWLVHES